MFHISLFIVLKLFRNMDRCPLKGCENTGSHSSTVSFKMESIYTFCKFSQQRWDFSNSHYGTAADGVPDHGHLPCSSGGGDIAIGLLVEAASRA